MRYGGKSLLEVDDLYYDGFLDPKYTAFDEYTQTKFLHKLDDGWDSYEEDEDLWDEDE